MRRYSALAVVLLAIPFAGCLKSKDTFTLNKDGSGTIVSTYSVDMTKARDLITTASALTGQGSPEAIAKADDLSLWNFEHPNWFTSKASKVEGYDVASATQSLTGGEVVEKDKDGKEAKKDSGPRTRVTRVEASFASMAAAAQADAFAITAITLSKVEKSEKLPKGAWKLVVKDAFSGLDPSQTGGVDPAQMLPMFESQLKKGLAVTLAFTVPGKILETNGTKSEDGRSASTVITYDRILEGKSLALNIVFEATDDMKLKPFTSSPDMMSLFNRLMGKPPGLEAAKKDAGKKAGGGAEGEGEDDAPPGDAPPGDAPKADAPKADAPKADAPKEEPKKDAAPKKAEPVK